VLADPPGDPVCEPAETCEAGRLRITGRIICMHDQQDAFMHAQQTDIPHSIKIMGRVESLGVHF
jgi:hypothetical protein